MRGFTLIELLLYMGLVALFLTAATTSTLDVILGSVKSSVQQEVQENLRYATHRIQFEIRNADSINTTQSNFGVNLATNPSTKVSFSAPAPYNPLEFIVKSGVLQIRSTIGGDDAEDEDDDENFKPLTSNLVEVTSLIFSNLTDGSSENIRFTITIRYKNPSGRSQWDKSATFEGGANLR